MTLRGYFADTIKVASATFTRQANTTAYTAGQVVSDGATTHLMKFPNAVRLEGYGAGRGGYVVKGRIFTDNKNWTGQMRLYLYNLPESGLTIPADAALFTTVYADRAARIGFIDFPAMVNDDGGVSSTGAYSEFPLTVPLAYEGTSNTQPAPAGSGTTVDDAIYGVLVIKNGATPASAQNFFVELTFDRA